MIDEYHLFKPSSFWHQFYALTKKEIKISLRYPVSYLSSFLQIFIMIALFTIVAKLFLNPLGNNDGFTTTTLATYMFWGLLEFMFFSNSLYTLGLSLRLEQTTGTLETIFLYPINHLANLLAKTTWGVFSNFIFGIFGFFALELVTGSIIVQFPEFFYALVIFLCFLVQIYGVAFFIAGLSIKLKESIEPIVNFGQFVIMLICSIFFPFSVLGPVVFFSYLIPMSYCIDLLRSTIFNSPPELAMIFAQFFGLTSYVVEFEWVIMLFFTIFLPLFGYWYFIHTIKAGRSTGTLSDY